MLIMLLNGRYKLQELIGQGGMGAVHRAWDRLSGEWVALKQVSLHEVSNLEPSSEYLPEAEKLRLALTREFQILAGLRHPNIISVLDYGFDGNGHPFYTMTYLPDGYDLLTAGDGRSLAEKIDLITHVTR
ncbi:MAG: hypothetical protein AAF633_16165 [Chloroflexota bacterium]